jgi:hypothetical protein
MHDGRAQTLADAIGHGPAAPTLTAEAVQDLIAFLTTLAPDE